MPTLCDKKDARAQAAFRNQARKAFAELTFKKETEFYCSKRNRARAKASVMTQSRSAMGMAQRDVGLALISDCDLRPHLYPGKLSRLDAFTGIERLHCLSILKQIFI